MATLRAIVCFKSVRFAALLALILFAGRLYGLASMRGRITPELERAMADGRLVNVVASLSFVPEQFHLGVFQTYGSIGGARGQNVIVRRVTPDAVRALAKYYWIERIDIERPRISPERPNF
jgi:hypothetical protein